MRENPYLKCPVCNGEIVDTRHSVQPYNDFDDYAGFRCSSCNNKYTDHEAIALASEIEE